MRVCAPGLSLTVMLVTAQARLVVLIRRTRPGLADGVVRFVTVNTPELRVATAPHGITELRGVPGGHASGKERAVADVTAGANPIDVRMRPAVWIVPGQFGV